MDDHVHARLSDGIVDGDDLPDDDPDIVAGMQHLAELREAEHDVVELRIPHVSDAT